MKLNDLIKKVRRVVIKIGTSSVTHSDGTIDIKQMEAIAGQIEMLVKKNMQVVIVTSGAVGAGIAQLGLKQRPNDLSVLQACAAVGQCQLMHSYSEIFRKRGFTVAQVLLTAEDLRNRKRFLNARNTIFSLLDKKTIPIVNENDTVAVDEIKFGDNDRLSALVTNLVEGDLLIVLSDVDGLYDEKGGLIKEVAKITKEIEGYCRGRGSELGTGGMITKIYAAKIVTAAGEIMVITNGRKKDAIIEIFEDRFSGTVFIPSGKALESRKRWLAFFTGTHGALIVDQGAYEALVNKGRSLLATGITGVSGHFKLGDVVKVADKEGREFGRGLVNYDSEEIKKIKGLKTSEIFSVLGYKNHDEVIHRNNIVIL